MALVRSGIDIKLNKPLYKLVYSPTVGSSSQPTFSHLWLHWSKGKYSPEIMSLFGLEMKIGRYC